MIVHEVSGHFVKMSGTAIILVYYRLRHMPETVFVLPETRRQCTIFKGICFGISHGQKKVQEDNSMKNQTMAKRILALAAASAM